jgi:hypothetical protein
MLGSSQTRISRDVKALWPQRFRHALLNEGQVRTLYCIAMYRHAQYTKGRFQVGIKEIREFLGQPDEAIWLMVETVGGSLEDCNRGIEEILISRNQRQLEQQAINVESTVA